MAVVPTDRGGRGVGPSLAMFTRYLATVLVLSASLSCPLAPELQELLHTAHAGDLELHLGKCAAADLRRGVKRARGTTVERRYCASLKSLGGVVERAAKLRRAARRALGPHRAANGLRQASGSPWPLRPGAAALPRRPLGHAGGEAPAVAGRRSPACRGAAGRRARRDDRLRPGRARRRGPARRGREARRALARQGSRQ